MASFSTSAGLLGADAGVGVSLFDPTEDIFFCPSEMSGGDFHHHHHSGAERQKFDPVVQIVHYLRDNGITSPQEQLYLIERASDINSAEVRDLAQSDPRTYTLIRNIHFLLKLKKH